MTKTKTKQTTDNTVIVIRKPIPGYANYEADNLGRIWCTGPLALHKMRLGRYEPTYGNISKTYMRANLWIDQRNRARPVHILIAHAFLGLPSDGRALVLHLDGNGYNNNLDNLMYSITTYEQDPPPVNEPASVGKPVSTIRIKPRKSRNRKKKRAKAPRPMEHYSSDREHRLDMAAKTHKLTPAQVIEVWNLLRAGQHTLRTIATMYGVSDTMISKIKMGHERFARIIRAHQEEAEKTAGTN